jgi:regulator of protease activity HflC (stomatin/prohibitin superfamily)
MRREMINISEGEKQRRINAAEGKAQEILSIAKATGESIEKIAHAINLEGGKAAIELQLSEQYLQQIKGLRDKSRSIIIPGNLLDYEQWMKTIKLAP